MIGPVILDYLVDYYTRFNSSTDAILTILQVGAILVPMYFLAQLMSFSLASSLETFYIWTADYACSYYTLESSVISTRIIRLSRFAGNPIDSTFFSLDRGQGGRRLAFSNTIHHCFSGESSSGEFLCSCPKSSYWIWDHEVHPSLFGKARL